MTLGNKSARNVQKRQKFIKTLLFLIKRTKFELIRNITHQMKSLRESFIPQNGATEDISYDYKKTTSTGKN